VDEVAGVVDSLDHNEIGSGSVSPGSFPSCTSSGQLVEVQGEISLMKMQKLLIQFRMKNPRNGQTPFKVNWKKAMLVY
jgi:hypothetical protein